MLADGSESDFRGNASKLQILHYVQDDSSNADKLQIPLTSSGQALQFVKDDSSRVIQS